MIDWLSILVEGDRLEDGEAGEAEEGAVGQPLQVGPVHHRAGQSGAVVHTHLNASRVTRSQPSGPAGVTIVDFSQSSQTAKLFG